MTDKGFTAAKWAQLADAVVEYFAHEEIRAKNTDGVVVAPLLKDIGLNRASPPSAVCEAIRWAISTNKLDAKYGRFCITPKKDLVFGER